MPLLPPLAPLAVFSLLRDRHGVIVDRASERNISGRPDSTCGFSGIAWKRTVGVCVVYKPLVAEPTATTDRPEGQLDRLRVLVDAGIALSSELSIDSLLQRIVETAAELTGARYAALGVIDRAGQGLERFLTTGIDVETHSAIGELPRGRGILGVLIREARPLRLHDIAEDPRSVGFPRNHPPMRSFLGVPIVLRGVAYGNLYLTEKAGDSDFTAEDQELTQLLAAQAAVAIENARLYESSTRWLRQLESLNEIGSALASEVELEPLLALVARRLRELIDARIVLIALPDAAETLRVVAAAGDDELIGMRLELGSTKIGRVLERGRTERVDAVMEDPEVDQRLARGLGITSALYLPLSVRGQPIGVVAAHDKLGADPRFEEGDSRLAESLVARAAIAVDLSERVSRDALRRVVEAQELERARLARELHDETGQALTSILLGLKSLEDGAETEEARRAVTALRELVVSTLQNVRRLAVELRPSALDHFGLVPALERLVATLREHSELIVDFEARLGDERLPAETETALYRIVQEALTNVVKHSGASRVSITVVRKETSAVAVVEDDGRGFDVGAAREGALGVAGMRERVALVAGRLTVESRPGAGTTLVAEVPLVRMPAGSDG
jgi:signal transduction histidine kinase